MSLEVRSRTNHRSASARRVRVVDMAAVAARLCSRPRQSADGLRETAISRTGAARSVFVIFQASGVRRYHRAGGAVTIHVLDGRLEVLSGGESHLLGPGQLMAMEPGLSHSVRAVMPSEMLLTVHRRPGRTAGRVRARTARDADAAPLFGGGPAGESGPVLLRLSP